MNDFKRLYVFLLSITFIFFYFQFVTHLTGRSVFDLTDGSTTLALNGLSLTAKSTRSQMVQMLVGVLVLFIESNERMREVSTGTRSAHKV